MTENAPQPPRLDKEWVRGDIDHALELRRDYYKYSIGVATALLAFTISFPPSLSQISCTQLIFVAWLALGVSILCGIVIHYLWAWFFISFRDLDNKGNIPAGVARRAVLNKIRISMEVVQVIALAIGVLGTALFAGLNIDNIALKTTDKAPTTTVAP